MKILIVDDSKTQRMIIRCSLKMAGYRDDVVLEAQSGRQALAMIKCAQPDFMLLDLNLPEMSGKDVVQALKQDNLSIPFALITAESDPKILREMQLYGAAFIIAKPFTANNLRDRMESALKYHRL